MSGLADLASYTSTLKLSFSGTLNGHPEEWAKTYTMLSSRDPAAKQWTIDGQENGSAADEVLQFEMSGADYLKRGTWHANRRTLNLAFRSVIAWSPLPS